MFGMMEAMLSFLRRQIGLRTDSASATGSAHAKLAYIAANTGIKSIQRGVINLGTSATSATATITSVNTSKAMVNFLGASSAGVLGEFNSSYFDGYYLRGRYSKNGHHFVRVALTNATTVTVTRAEANGATAVVSYEVIEFY